MGEDCGFSKKKSKLLKYINTHAAHLIYDNANGFPLAVETNNYFGKKYTI